MKRLSHPIRAIREPFGTAGLIVAMIALVAALGGTAFAAAKLNSTQKKEVEKIAKKFAGKPGTNGANGTNGGPGEKGAAGAAGSAGLAGKSVTTVAAVVGSGPGKCEAGGTKFEVESSGHSEVVCNGKNGTTGFTETLPAGKTEKGTWSANFGPKNSFLEVPVSYSPISFVIPLSTAPTAEVLTESQTTGNCPGSAESPEAEEGFLCVYEGFESSHVLFAEVSAAHALHDYGAVVTVLGDAEGNSTFGSWAVTAG